jgi:hypothetical protein
MRDSGWPLGLGAILLITGALLFIPAGTSLPGALMLLVGLGLLVWAWNN